MNAARQPGKWHAGGLGDLAALRDSLAQHETAKREALAILAAPHQPIDAVVAARQRALAAFNRAELEARAQRRVEARQRCLAILRAATVRDAQAGEARAAHA